MPDIETSKYGNVPPEVEREELAALERLWKAARPWRFLVDTVWATSIAMTEGHQWLSDARQGGSTSRGRSVFMIQRDTTDPSVDMIRVTLNRTKDLTEEVVSLLRVDPRGWEGVFDVDNRDPLGSQTQLRIERAVWRDYLPTINLAGEAKMQNEWRGQCGSGLLKATPDRMNPYGWDIVCVPLDRMIWDNACKHPDPERHAEWADSAAWSADDAMRAYGIELDKKKLPTMSQLRAFDQAVGQIRGLQYPMEEDANTPGVLVTERYWDYWRGLTIYVHTGVGQTHSRVVWRGPNPYGKCPFFKTDLGTSLMMPWGIGVPWRIKTDQRIINFVMTHIMRHLVTSAPRWVYEEGSVPNAKQAFSPRMNSPIAFTPQRGDRMIPPTNVSPAELSRTPWELFGALPLMMSEQLHIRPVMQGITSPRGESGQAVQLKLSQAGRVYVKTGEEDELAARRFLSHHAQFIANQPHLMDRLVQAVGPALKAALLERAAQAQIIDMTITVSLPPGSIQPATPQEKKDNLMQLAALQVFSADELKIQLYRQTGQPVTAEQETAISNAVEENRMFMGGGKAEQIDAKNYEPHAVHIYVHGQLIRERHTMGVPDEIVREVQWHIADHFDEQGEEEAQRGAMTMEGQGAFGATKQASQLLLADTPTGGGMGAPMATPAQYGARETMNQATAM